MTNPVQAIARARELGLGVGVACSPGTPIEDLAAAAQGADLALCMSIEPGYSGQEFMPDALARIEQLRQRVPEGVRVQVDGGINAKTIASARAAGADLLVVGSAIFWRDDPEDGYADLVAVIEEHAGG